MTTDIICSAIDAGYTRIDFSGIETDTAPGTKFKQSGLYVAAATVSYHIGIKQKVRLNPCTATLKTF